MESVIWQCEGCGEFIDRDTWVVEYIERRFEVVGGVEREQPVFHYAHVGHDHIHKQRHLAKTGEGVLRSLRTRDRGDVEFEDHDA